jgi:hypothetical protein
LIARRRNELQQGERRMELVVLLSLFWRIEGEQIQLNDLPLQFLHSPARILKLRVERGRDLLQRHYPLLEPPQAPGRSRRRFAKGGPLFVRLLEPRHLAENTSHPLFESGALGFSTVIELFDRPADLVRR